MVVNNKKMIKYETLINAEYWILDGMGIPFKAKLKMHNPHSENCGLFGDLHLSRKYSECFRTKKEAIEYSKKHYSDHD